MAIAMTLNAKRSAVSIVLLWTIIVGVLLLTGISAGSATALEIDEQDRTVAAAGEDTFTTSPVHMHSIADSSPYASPTHSTEDTTASESTETHAIDSCQTISESGSYELTSDIAPSDPDDCLVIEAENVTIDGNGYTVAGPDSANDTNQSGIVLRVPASDGQMGGDPPTEVSIANVQVNDWDDGLLMESDTALEIQNADFQRNTRGIFSRYADSLMVNDVTIEESTEQGVLSWFAEVTVTDSEIRDNRYGLVLTDENIRIDRSQIENNDRDGVSIPDASAEITNTDIRQNGLNGITHYLSFSNTLENVTLESNGAYEIGPPDVLEPTQAPGVQFDVNNSVFDELPPIEVMDFSGVAFETVPEPDLPPFDEGVTVIGDGFNTTDAQLKMQFDLTDQLNESVALWYHDGDAWSSVADPDDDQYQLEDDGIYALVEAAEGPEDQSIDSCTTITEPGQYELTRDLHSPDGETCLAIESGDVSIDGNGHSIAADTENAAEQTTGIVTDTLESEHDGEVKLHDMTVTGWETGIDVNGDEAVLRDIVVSENEYGATLQPGGILQSDNATVTENHEVGIYSEMAGHISLDDSAIIDNDAGIQGFDGSHFDIDGSEIVDNTGTGIVASESQGDISNTTVSNNDGAGIHAQYFGHLTIDRVELSNNSRYELTTVDEMVGTATAIGSDVILDMDDPGTIGASQVAQQDLPSAPSDVEFLTEGLNVTQSPVPESDGLRSVTATFATDNVDANAVVELWHYDGDDWVLSEFATLSDGTLETTIDEYGIYALVNADDDDDSDQDNGADDPPDDTDQDDRTDEPPEDTDDETDIEDEVGPGFGILAAVVALVMFALLGHRLDNHREHNK